MFQKCSFLLVFIYTKSKTKSGLLSFDRDIIQPSDGPWPLGSWLLVFAIANSMIHNIQDQEKLGASS